MKIPCELSWPCELSPQVSIPAPKPNIVEDVHVQQLPFSSNDSLPLLSWGGLELKENIYVDG